MDEMYEVTRDEFVGFKDQFKSGIYLTEKDSDDKLNTLKYISIKTGALLCAQTEDINTGDMKYYVITMPDDDERKAPPRKRKIELQTREEVEAFFKIINDLIQESQKNGN